MKRRIRAAIVGVSLIVLLALGVPLAILIHRTAVDAELLELEAEAASSVAGVRIPVDAHALDSFTSKADTARNLGVYDPTGVRVAGVGPRRGDEAVRRALRGVVASSSADALVVVTPVVQPTSTEVRGALRITESLTEAQHRAQAGYLLMGAAGVFALSLAWVIGSRLARTLSEPLSDLAARAESIGDGSALEPELSSGISEIDSLAAVLQRRGRDVNAAIRRERQFSADVSHQLRTPITALRLKLEQLQSDGVAPPSLAAAMHDLDRVEATTEHLLSVARDSIPRPGPIQLDEVVSAVVERWQTPGRSQRRQVVADRLAPTTALAHRAAINEVLDVLIDNALRHGTGSVTVALRPVGDGVAVDVADEGRSIDPLRAERVFERGHGAGTGLGLAVARAVAEAEGGRLVLSGHDPTTFSLLLMTQ